MPGLTEFFGRAADVVVTLEDHVLMGGYGSAVLELFNEKRITTPVIQVGWPDQFIEHASTPEELRQKYGLTVENTVAKVRAEFAQAAVTGAERRRAAPLTICTVAAGILPEPHTHPGALRPARRISSLEFLPNLRLPLYHTTNKRS